jgi:hypothetical protein
VICSASCHHVSSGTRRREERKQEENAMARKVRILTQVLGGPCKFSEFSKLRSLIQLRYVNLTIARPLRTIAHMRLRRNSGCAQNTLSRQSTKHYYD